MPFVSTFGGGSIRNLGGFVTSFLGISLNYQGGSGGATSLVQRFGTFATMPTPTQSGYNFLGWYDAVSGGNKIADAGATYLVLQPKTLYAQWTVANYTVTYNNNGGTGGSSSASVSIGSSTTLPTPTQTSYVLNGWYTEASGGTKIANAGSAYTPSSSITLYAQWTAGYVVTYNYSGNYAGGDATTTTTVLPGTFITLPTPTRANYLFADWFSTGYGYSPGGASIQINESRVFAVDWAATYYVYYNVQGAVGGDFGVSASVGYTTVLPTLTYNNMQFNGWYTAASGGTRVGGAGDLYTGTIVQNQLYAQWTSLLLTVTFNNSGGSGGSSSLQQSSIGGTITLPNPGRDGYYLTGWYDAVSGGTKIGKAGETYTPTTNVTLYAQWSQLFPFAVYYTIVAGGGGGGEGGGGGGAVSTNITNNYNGNLYYLTLYKGHSYTFVVGAGGAGGGTTTVGSKGGQSYIYNNTLGSIVQVNTAVTNNGFVTVNGGGGGGFIGINNGNSPQYLDAPNGLPLWSNTGGAGITMGTAYGNAQGFVGPKGSNFYWDENADTVYGLGGLTPAGATALAWIGGNSTSGANSGTGASGGGGGAGAAGTNGTWSSDGAKFPTYTYGGGQGGVGINPSMESNFGSSAAYGGGGGGAYVGSGLSQGGSGGSNNGGTGGTDNAAAGNGNIGGGGGGGASPATGTGAGNGGAGLMIFYFPYNLPDSSYFDKVRNNSNYQIYSGQWAANSVNGTSNYYLQRLNATTTWTF